MAENEVEEPGGEPEAQPPLCDLEQLRELIRLCRENEIAELKIRHQGTRIHIKGRGANAPPPVEYVAKAVPPVEVPPSVPVIVPPPAEEGARVEAEESPELEDETLTAIRSPMVGTFYRAPAPDAAPFVEVGDAVKESTVLCIVEAMKLMNEIKAELRGTVAKILVENGQPVEYNQPLFLIKPD
jgi:acetyl-CoA carboxylase biotin carboxyl carrier protein